MPPPVACTSISISLSLSSPARSLSSENILGRRACVLADKRIYHALLGRKLGTRLHVLAFSFPRLNDRDFDKITHDLLDIATDIARPR